MIILRFSSRYFKPLLNRPNSVIISCTPATPSHVPAKPLYVTSHFSISLDNSTPFCTIPALSANLRYFHDLPFLSRYPGYFKPISQLNYAQESLLIASLLCSLKPLYSTLNDSFSGYCGPGYFLIVNLFYFLFSTLHFSVSFQLISKLPTRMITCSRGS